MATKRAPKLEPNHAEIPPRVWNTYAAARRNREQWEAIEKEQRALIEDALGDDEIGLVEGTPVVTFKHSKANRLNQAKLKAEHPELVAEFYEFSETRTFKPVEGAI